MKTLEEAAERYYIDNIFCDGITEFEHDIAIRCYIAGAKWQQNDCVQFINKLEDESFDGWSKEAKSGYLTACMTIKQKYIDTLNGN